MMHSGQHYVGDDREESRPNLTTIYRQLMTPAYACVPRNTQQPL